MNIYKKDGLNYFSYWRKYPKKKTLYSNSSSSSKLITGLFPAVGGVGVRVKEKPGDKVAILLIEQSHDFLM